MKAIKYIISFCIIFVGMLIIGESHIFYLDNFYTRFDHTTMYLQSDTTDEEMVQDILRSAERHKVDVFTFIRSPRSTFLTEFDIYGTSGVERHLNEQVQLSEREYMSLFLGSLRFTFHQLEDIPTMENVHDFYVIGRDKQVYEFKMDLINKYAGNHPKDGYVSKESRNTIMSIWLLITSIILLLSYYDVILQKKENLIRISLGERISKIVWRNIVLDSFVLISLFVIVVYVLSKYTYVFFRLDISLIFFSLLLLLNAFLYVNLYFFNVKEVFSNVKGSKKLLSLNYGLKLVTAVITIFVLSSNIMLISESYRLYKQKSFFKDYADYYYTRLEYKPVENSDGAFDVGGNESTMVQVTFYKEFFGKYNATLLASTSGLFNGQGILANKNALDYLSGEIKELRNQPLTKEIYVLLPKKWKGDTRIIDEINSAILFYIGDQFTDDYDLIYYTGNREIISIDENYTYGSKLVKDPIIIYDNRAADALEFPIENQSPITYVHEIMYKIPSEQEFNRFVEAHDLKGQIVAKTNVFENYKNKWVMAKRVLYMNSIFSLLVLLLEWIIISSIIKLEYEVNAIELSIKKVLGHSIFEKNRKIVLMTAVTTLLSIISAVWVAYALGLSDVYYLVVGGVVIIVLELLVIVFYICKIENAKISKILKGGNI
ncbi:hypothetical protein [Anoxybacteroides rupiense]|uniref:hypothetical protein n=1 Tax=Anoxybacteroides rupiense TaxID=311460 RepID=UPI00160638E7|nr:hypothetical protein [Anoxybacillus rupiensis]MBB3907805.1 hypothetical protein [Anoxybacillus rupiensis]